MDERYTKEQLWKLIGENLKRTEDFLLLYSLEALKEYEENAERIQGIPLEPITIERHIYRETNDKEITNEYTDGTHEEVWGYRL